MAGDWIKIECSTPDKPEIVQMATLLRIDQDAVVGKLLRVWLWADQNSVEGAGVTITAAFIDRLTSRRGFAAAMRGAGWLMGDDGAMTFPNFARHNGVTAKKRAESNRRVASHRGRNGDVTPAALQKALPEKRERREEKSTDHVPEIPAAPPGGSTPPPAGEADAPGGRPGEQPSLVRFPAEGAPPPGGGADAPGGHPSEQPSLAQFRTEGAPAPSGEADDTPGGRPGEQPSLAQFQAECARYSVPAWYAELKFNNFAVRGWRIGASAVVWREAIKRWVVRDYGNDGRPLQPPAPGGARGRVQMARLALPNHTIVIDNKL